MGVAATLPELSEWTLRATEISQLCCKGIKVRPDVFWDLNITFKYFLCLRKKNSQ